MASLTMFPCASVINAGRGTYGWRVQGTDEKGVDATLACTPQLGTGVSQMLPHLHKMLQRRVFTELDARLWLFSGV